MACVAPDQFWTLLSSRIHFPSASLLHKDPTPITPFSHLNFATFSAVSSMASAGKKVWMPSLLLLLISVLSFAWTSALIFPTPYCDISPLCSLQPALFLCMHPYKICLCYQTAEGTRARSSRTKSVTVCSHLQATHASLMRPSFLQWQLPSEGHTDPERASQAEFPLSYRTPYSIWPWGSVCSASALPPPSHPSSLTQGKGVSLATAPTLYLPK